MAMPKHIAISLDSFPDWRSDNNAGINELIQAYFKYLGKLLDVQAKLRIQVVTIYLFPETAEKSGGAYFAFCEKMSEFFAQLSEKDIVHENKIKISVFGKWYNLPGRAIESLKNIIELTKDYNRFFANFCINYDGQEEIVDACRLVAKQVELGKINPEMITKDSVKESLYSSNFMPPDIILIYGEKKLSGLLLWDSVNSKIVFAGKSFMEFEEGDVEKIYRIV